METLTTETDPYEVTYTFNCAGQRTTQVMANIIPFCLGAREAARRPHLIIEQLGMLAGSITLLLKALSRMAEDYEARIVLSDSSGCTVPLLQGSASRKGS